MDTPDVRPAQSSDQSAVGDLWEELLSTQAAFDDRVGISEDARDRWENDFPMWVDDDSARLFVAESEEGTIIGFATARQWGPPPVYEESAEVFLDELFVDPEHRRQGYGKQLVRAVRDWAEEIEARRIRLRVLTSNADGRAFWAAQDAIPLSMTLTIEGRSDGATESDEGTKKIGFQSERTG